MDASWEQIYEADPPRATRPDNHGSTTGSFGRGALVCTPFRHGQFHSRPRPVHGPCPPGAPLLRVPGVAGRCRYAGFGVRQAGPHAVIRAKGKNVELLKPDGAG